MYKVLLVDDEILIREAISENIHWNELGFELNGMCENGKQAIEVIKENPPDLIISDICMPYVDGIELAKYVYENNPDIKIVIISGYDNFSYAKSAIKYRVMEYILKPVTAYELSEMLEKIKIALDEDREHRQMNKILGAYEKSKPLLRDRFLNQLIREKCEEADAKERLEGYNVFLDSDCYSLIQVLGQSGFDYESPGCLTTDELVLFSVYNVVEEILHYEEQCIVFQESGNITTVLMGGESEYQLEEKIIALFSKVQDSLKALLRVSTVVIAGKTVLNLGDLQKSHTNIKAVREFEFLFDENSILFGKDFITHKEEQIDLKRWNERFSAAIEQNNIRELKMYVQNFFMKVKGEYFSKNRIIACVQSIALKIMLDADSSRKDEQETFETGKNFLEELTSQKRLEDVEKIFTQFCLEMARKAERSKERLGEFQISKVLEYMEKNYKDSSISLNSACRYMSMSTSYFSVMFKNNTGETFNQALTKKRIEKAKELLSSTTLRSYEIAEEVGYSDPHYFSSIFKKYVGVTPTEYAKKRR